MLRHSRPKEAETYTTTETDAETTSGYHLGSSLNDMLIKIFASLMIDLCAACGIIISVTTPMDYVNGIEKSLAGLGGLIMLYYSIQYKILLIKKEKRELEQPPKKEEDETAK